MLSFRFNAIHGFCTLIIFRRTKN